MTDLMDVYYPVLDHGFIALVDKLGSDESIERAARVSYGKGTRQKSKTRGLVRYLVRHRHTSPLEMGEMVFHLSMPIFVARQWIRHRTACISGDTKLEFDLPGGIDRRGNQKHTLTVREIYERFQPTENKTRPDKQKNPYHKRDRIKNKLLRSVNEDTGEVYHTRIVDIWESGEKPVYLLLTESGQAIKASKDHLFYTPEGWKKLEAISPGDSVVTVGPAAEGTNVNRYVPVVDESLEEWRPVRGYEDVYEVSNYGRVMRVGKAPGAVVGTIKQQTVTESGYAVVSLSNKKGSKAKLIHHLVLEAFVGKPPHDKYGAQARHLDGNSLNNHVDNLAWGTAQENADDRIGHGRVTSLASKPTKVVSIDLVGTEMTYDIEVQGPYHNFVADGLVIHNSLNEASARYSLMPQATFRPEEFRLQSTTNKQGSSETALDGFRAAEAGKALDEAYSSAWGAYEALIEEGVTRELSRVAAPVGAYTEMYWKIDLNNLLHFLNLRTDPHAQEEIRVYADIMAAMVKEEFPLVYEAWVDFQVSSITFTGPEIRHLQGHRELRNFLKENDPVRTELDHTTNLSDREKQEFLKKIATIVNQEQYALVDNFVFPAPLESAEAAQLRLHGEIYADV